MRLIGIPVNSNNSTTKHAGNPTRAAVELAKDWRTDKYLRRLEALMAIGDKEKSFIISGTGDVLELWDPKLWEIEKANINKNSEKITEFLSKQKFILEERNW